MKIIKDAIRNFMLENDLNKFFTEKTIESKKMYKRNPKHKGKGYE